MSKTASPLSEQYLPLFDHIVRNVGTVSAAVYGVIWRYCQTGDGRCWATHKIIGRELAVSPRTVVRHLEILREAGYIAVESQRPILPPSTDRDHCSICGTPYPLLDQHHIIPLEDGGTDDPSNVTYLCPNCHRLMHAKAQYYVLGDGGSHE